MGDRGVQRRLRGLLVLVACYQSAAPASAALVRHIVLGSGPPRGHSICMGIHAHLAVSSMVLGPFRKDALDGL